MIRFQILCSLSDSEYAKIKLHVDFSVELITKAIEVDFPQECKYLTTAIAQHHERQEGQGYPHKLTGDKISRAGKILGIAGPPGSGKTALLGLIPRLYDVSGGRILIDGEDIRAIALSDIRSMISFMPQEPFLFAGTIRDNITLGSRNIEDSGLEDLLEKASLSGTIKNFPAGLDTIVGEKGIILSGGQRQRIALARSLLSDSPILILDDPVSQVDVETGSAIIRNIRSMAEEKTIIIVSHRLSALSFADKIIVIDRGRITESGNHASLVELGKYYAKTFGMQAIEEEMNAI